MRTRGCCLPYLLAAAGAGLLLSLLISGWFARLVAGLGLLVLGLLTMRE